jgi:hypothetical protein
MDHIFDWLLLCVPKTSSVLIAWPNRLTSTAMIALFFLFLTLSVSPFKSKSRLEAENAALRHQLIVLQRRVREWGSLVLGPAVSMVSIGAQGHHYHPTGDPSALASGRLPSVLAVEIPLSWRPAPNRRGPARADPADEH